jgi:hypothetical protein
VNDKTCPACGGTDAIWKGKPGVSINEPCPACAAPASFVVKTANGYVGRASLDAELTDSMPYGFAYTYDTETAALIAERFGGQPVPTR